MPPEQRVVFLDPDGSAPISGFVIVAHPTGVMYQQQYGGTACLQGRMEGYLVPVDLGEARPRLDDLFIKTLKRAGLGSPRSQNEDVLALLRQIVETVCFWPSVSDTNAPPSTLSLDEDRADQVDEAWIPIVSADGPGVLIWENSD